MPAITRGSKSNSILYCGAEQSWSIRRCRLPTALRRVAAPLPCRCCPCALLSLRLSLCCSHHPSVVCYSHCTIARLVCIPSPTVLLLCVVRSSTRLPYPVPKEVIPISFTLPLFSPCNNTFPDYIPTILTERALSIWLLLPPL